MLRGITGVGRRPPPAARCRPAPASRPERLAAAPAAAHPPWPPLWPPPGPPSMPAQAQPPRASCRRGTLAPACASALPPRAPCLRGHPAEACPCACAQALPPARPKTRPARMPNSGPTVRLPAPTPTPTAVSHPPPWLLGSAARVGRPRRCGSASAPFPLSGSGSCPTSRGEASLLWGSGWRHSEGRRGSSPPSPAPARRIWRGTRGGGRRRPRQ
mmetsp:Transcript_32349/g.96337  ORF Transcript_32349/g.96337 Transcript_32349/m.96337 type:complete len:215 (-) Transcript_32349:538-1182(-)